MSLPPGLMVVVIRLTILPGGGNHQCKGLCILTAWCLLHSYPGKLPFLTGLQRLHTSNRYSLTFDNGINIFLSLHKTIFNRLSFSR